MQSSYIIVKISMKKFLKPTIIITCLVLILIIGIWGLGEALIPLVCSFVLSYLLFPIIKKMESRGINRKLSVTTVFITICLVMIFLFSLILPTVINDTKELVRELPKTSVVFIEKIEQISTRLGFNIEISKDSLSTYIHQHVNSISTSLLKDISQSIGRSFTGIAHFLLMILNLFLIPLFFFYVINDYEKFINELQSFIPQALRPKLNNYATLTNNVLSGYFRGQLMVALALSVLYALGLQLIGLRFGILIGIISGIISVIPYAGFTIGFLTSLIIAIANYTSVTQIFLVIAVFVIVQTLEGFLITPKLVGDKVGLSAFATMLALIIGGNIFGVLGMLLAIPCAAIIKSILVELKNEYQQLDIYKET